MVSSLEEVRQSLADLGGWGAAAKKTSAQKSCGFIGDDGVRCSVAPQTNARYCEKHMPRDENDAEDCTEVEVASCWPT